MPPKEGGMKYMPKNQIFLFEATPSQTKSGAYFIKQLDGWKAYQAENQEPRVLIPAAEGHV